MRTSCIPSTIQDQLQSKADTLAGEAGFTFIITDDSIALTIRNYMIRHGQDIPIKDIKDNKPLMESYKYRLYMLKGEMASVLTRIQKLSTASANLALLGSSTGAGNPGLTTALTTAGTALVGTSGSGAGISAAVLGITSLLQSGSLATAKDNYLLQISAIEYDIQNIFGQAAEMELGLPSSFLSRIDQLATYKLAINAIQ